MFIRDCETAVPSKTIHDLSGASKNVFFIAFCLRIDRENF